MIHKQKLSCLLALVIALGFQSAHACSAATGTANVGNSVNAAVSTTADSNGWIAKLNGYALKSTVLMRQLLVGYKVVSRAPSAEPMIALNTDICADKS